MSELAILAADAGVLDTASDPMTFVVLACERAKSWLVQAVEQGDIDQIVDIKTAAEICRLLSLQRQLGKDAELAAAEIVRRAERGIGVAIRRGQEEGTIRAQGWNGRGEGVAVHNSLSPTDFVSRVELSGSGRHPGILAVTDNVSDEQFEDAVTEAKAERNLSRANVVRKVTARVSNTPAAAESRVTVIRALAADGNTSAQIAAQVSISEERVRDIARRCSIPLVDAVIGKTRRIDSARIMAEAVSSLEALALGADLIEVDQLPAENIGDWATSLSNSLRSLNRLCKQLKEIAQ